MIIRETIWLPEVEEKIIANEEPMANEENETVSSISKSRSIAEMAAFWDSHDATDFDDQTYEVEMEFDLALRRHYIAIDPELLTRLRKIAMERGIGVESLANLWLQERVVIANRRSGQVPNL